MRDKRNYFLDGERAGRYTEARPSFHAQALSAYHQASSAVIYERALDVACGTGQSSIALTSWSKSVDAIDNSEAMLKHALQHPQVNYHSGKAEELPFQADHFDLVFVASSLHWFERRPFLKEASRVLRPQGKLLIYDSVLKEGLTSDFTLGFNQRFPKTYSEVPLHAGELKVFNLQLVKNERYEFDSEFNDSQITKYFFNLSSVSADIEDGADANKAYSDIQSLVQRYSTGSNYLFEVSLTELIKI